nr:RHS repeat-associated core domain-containing protein [Dyella sp. 2HG41-7]
MTHIVENTVTTAFCYNAQGYVTQVSQTINGTTDVTTYTRSPGGKILSITHPSGDQVTYSYDTDGRISGVTATTASGTSTLVSNVSYQPFGPVSGYTLGNGQAITRTYDANYNLTDLVSPAFTLHMARDAMGDITAIGNSAGANPATETYSYDPLYRLTQITEADGSTLENVTYNPTGDRLTKTGSGLATGTYSYNPNTHQLVATGNAARTVDADGNTTAISQAGSTYGFGYNARNRMTLAQLNQSTVANYTYNAEGERVAKTANGNTERYNYGPSSQLLSEYGATNREYVYLDGIPVANLDTQGTTSSIAYVTADQLGTPRAISDNNGNTEWSWAYQGNAWGEQSPASNGYTYNLRFAGQYYDVETGLYANGPRYFDAAKGGFDQADPMGQAGGIGLYVYVGDNPIGYVDPLGLQRTGEIDPKEAEALNTPETNAEVERLEREREEAARARDTTPFLAPRPASEYGELGQCPATPPSTARVGPIGGNGGSPDFLTPGEIARIQNAANRIGRPINLVGSRATGTAGPNSDWDYVVDANAPTRNSVSRSLPGAGNLSEGVRPNLDVFNGQVNSGAPYVQFTPETKQ